MSMNSEHSGCTVANVSRACRDRLSSEVDVTFCSSATAELRSVNLDGWAKQAELRTVVGRLIRRSVSISRRESTMKKAALLVSLVVLSTDGSVAAIDELGPDGKPVPRRVAPRGPVHWVFRTVGSPAHRTCQCEITFANREEFESAWPHLLRLNSRGVPLTLLRGPRDIAGITTSAGVRILAISRIDCH